MKSASLSAACLCAALFVVGRASANPAYTQGYTHLRAGPSAEYPLVVTLPPNTLLDVDGCIDDFTWCDVEWQGNRGWAYGNFLYYDYQDRRVPILEFGAALGIGIVAFSIGDYWGRHYTERPWYGRESYWMHRPPPPRYPPGGGPGSHRPGWAGRPSGGGHGPGGGRFPDRNGPPSGGRPSRPSAPVGRPPDSRPPHAGQGAGGRPQRPVTRPSPGGAGGGNAGAGRPGGGGHDAGRPGAGRSGDARPGRQRGGPGQQHRPGPQNQMR